MANQKLVTLMGERFIRRRDVKAIQNPDGSWRPDRGGWRKGDIARHLDKESVYGHYLVDEDGFCKLFAFDIDLDKGGPREAWAEDEHERERLAREMLALAFGLAHKANRIMDLPMAVAYSGSKGMHVYGFTGPIAAAEAKLIATEFLDGPGYEQVRGELFWKNGAFPELTIEVFPKQETVGNGGLGNLMRLPLGSHNKGRDLPAPYNRPAFMRDTNLTWEYDNPVTALQLGSTRDRTKRWVGLDA